MKKLIAILLSLMMVLALAACGSSGGKTDGSENATSAQVESGNSSKKVSVDNTQGDPNLIDFGDYKALYKGGEITKNTDGTDALILTFDYTNDGSELKSFGWSFYYDVKQGSEELSSAIIYINDEKTKSISDSEFVQAEPGATMEIKLAYELVNLTDDVTIDFSDLLDEYKFTLTVKLSDCAKIDAVGDTASAQDESATSVQEESGDNTQGAGKLMKIGDYEALYKGSELTKSEDGTDAVILIFDFTNNGSEADSFGFSIYYTAKQGDDELDSPVAVFTTADETENIADSEFADIEPGATAEVKIAFELKNLTDDVNIEFSDLLDEYVENLTISLADCTQI